MSRILLHIGFRKAASTFIRDWFYSHPDLKMGGIQAPELSKFGYMENKPEYYVLSEAFLLFKGHYPPRTIENLKKFQRETCAELKSLFPEAKVLLITRAHRQCILSEYSEYVKNGGFQSFNEMKNDPISQEYFVGHYNYNFVIDLYTSTFGAENVLVLPMELLADDPDSFIRKLEAYLGLEHREFPLHKRNPALSDTQMWAFRKISSAVYKFSGLFGKRGKVLYFMYLKMMGKESYTNKRFRLPVYLMQFFKRKNLKQEMEIPEALLRQMQSNATILKEHPLYEKYLHLYLT